MAVTRAARAAATQRLPVRRYHSITIAAARAGAGYSRLRRDTAAAGKLSQVQVAVPVPVGRRRAGTVSDLRLAGSGDSSVPCRTCQWAAAASLRRGPGPVTVRVSDGRSPMRVAAGRP